MSFCVCVVPHMFMWWRCGSCVASLIEKLKNGEKRKTQSIGIRSDPGKIFSGKRKALHDICSNVRDVLVLNCFLCVVLKDLLIILLWDPCFLHDTCCESLFEMNLSYLICTGLCWTPFFSIVCWYVH